MENTNKNSNNKIKYSKFQFNKIIKLKDDEMNQKKLKG